MKKTVLILLALFLGLFVGISFAGEVTLFGPKQYLRTNGKPNVYMDTFAASYGLPAQGKLTILNGDEDGRNRISSAVIFVNGEEIFGPSDFNQQVYRLEAPVNLVEDNSIKVELRSKPGSYLTIEITREADPPTVTISAAPETVYIGQSSTLTWTSTWADSCVIEPGIGSVDLNGSVSVSPTETTTYTITATGPGGTGTDSAAVTAISPITLTITSPYDGETISKPDIMVEGTVANISGNEKGVVVNGVAGVVFGDQFVANHVPLQEGESIITAIGTDTDGYTASASITAYAETGGYYIRLTADTESGISPLETTLKVDGSCSFTESSLTYTGPGDVEFLENPNENEYTVKITTPGIYYFTAEVEDAENNIYTDTIAIEVMDGVQLDALLRARWDEMKAALGNQDIENALDYFAEHKKGLYEEIYAALYDNLPQLVQDMQDIELIYAEDNLAKYRIRKNELYGGEMLTITYYIYFTKDEKGLWKIYRY